MTNVTSKCIVNNIPPTIKTSSSPSRIPTKTGIRKTELQSPGHVMRPLGWCQILDTNTFRDHSHPTHANTLPSKLLIYSLLLTPHIGHPCTPVPARKLSLLTPGSAFHRHIRAPASLRLLCVSFYRAATCRLALVYSVRPHARRQRRAGKHTHTHTRDDRILWRLRLRCGSAQQIRHPCSSPKRERVRAWLFAASGAERLCGCGRACGYMAAAMCV